MNFQKITHGFVLQKFDQLGEFIGQTFTAGDDVAYETEDGDPINIMDMPLGGDEYQPFDMVQPNETICVVVENMPVVESGEYTVEETICPKLGYFTDPIAAEKKVNELNQEYAQKHPDAEDHEDRFGFVMLQKR